MLPEITIKINQEKPPAGMESFKYAWNYIADVSFTDENGASKVITYRSNWDRRAQRIDDTLLARRIEMLALHDKIKFALLAILEGWTPKGFRVQG